MSAIGLGATLYFPALRTDLAAIAHGAVPGLRSAVVCLEDAIADVDVGRALGQLALLLRTLGAAPPVLRLYVRPRSPAMLSALVRMPGIEAIEGFVLPKTDASNLAAWLAPLPGAGHRLMPTVEDACAFDRAALGRLRDALLPHRERITAVRIGGNDVLGLLGARRSRTRTAYEGPLGSVIADVAGTFLPAGLDVAAPVFEHYAENAVLQREIELDIEHGLLTKTAIHPLQIGPIQDAYRPDSGELADARAILAPDAPAVFGRGGSLCEPATHRGWAHRTLERARVHGVQIRRVVPTAAEPVVPAGPSVGPSDPAPPGADPRAMAPRSHR